MVRIGRRDWEVLYVLVSDEDGQGLVGDTGVAEQFHQVAQPGIDEAVRVEEPVHVLVLGFVKLAEVFLAVEPFRCTPRMVRSTGKVGKEQSLVLTKSFINHIFDIGAGFSLGITASVELASAPSKLDI